MGKMGCATPAAEGGDPVSGRALAAEHCTRCRGIDGKPANPAIPALAGQKVSYLLVQLQNFMNGNRHNTLMMPEAQKLSRAHEPDLAAYFSRQRWLPRAETSTPEDFMAGIMGKDASWWPVPAAVLIGVPMYTNAAGIIPVVETRIGKGAAWAPCSPS